MFINESIPIFKFILLFCYEINTLPFVLYIYKVPHLKPNGADGVSPLPRPCWIPQYRLHLCTRMGQRCALRSIVPATNMNRRLTLQQRIFVCKCYFKWEPPSRVRTEHIQTFPGEVPHSKFTIHEIVRKFETTGSVENKRRNRKLTILTEETLDKTGASLERTPTKSIPKLAQLVGISESSAHRATKLLKLKTYKCTSVHFFKTR